MKNYTKIPNDLLEILLNSALNNSQRRILIYIARKTYGYHKKTDRISWSQFQDKLKISRSTLSASFNKLKLVRLLILVKKGTSKKLANEWSIDISNYPDKLVRLSKLVRFDSRKLVRKPSDTKESITKERKSLSSKKNTAWDMEAINVLKSFGEIRP